ncbi:MAG: hypothetical protein ACHQFX_10075 [Chitinophagales bacterium]
MNGLIISAQPALNTNTLPVRKLNSALFFQEEQMISMDLSTDLKKLTSEKKLETYQPATVTCRFPDSSVISEPIRLTARGEFRRTECYVPSIKLDFKSAASPKLSPLSKLKLVVGCGVRADDEKLLLKEFLIYKMYNILTEKSFRVRLLHINYTDTRKKIRSYSQYGFLIEDVDKMAKRNKCSEVEKQVFKSEMTDREQMTLVAIFQYMIGNTDWSVPNYHNIKLMRPVTDSISFPYTVPYDFDFAGLVDAHYAIPYENLPITSVRQRLYRGYPRTLQEVQRTLDIFREKREAINKLVMSFELLHIRQRKDMISYLDEFYETIKSTGLVKRTFIDDARTN